MKKLIRRWLNRYKNQRRKKQFESQVGMNLNSLIKSCEEIVLEKTGNKIYTRFRDLGGANNHGMLLHYSVLTGKPIAISKIEESSLAEREYRFLSWQVKYRGNLLSATPLGLLDDSERGYSCFISSVLQHPERFSYDKALELFETLGKERQELSHLALDGSIQNLSFEIDPSTNIKSVLYYMVSRFGTNVSKDFYVEFLDTKKELLSTELDFYCELKRPLDDLYNTLITRDLSNYQGLVHGDFKPQNILEESNSYRVIDCQYYTYGVRLWDVAFLYSKDSKGFDNIKPELDRFSQFEEKALMLFFYVIASLINLKKKRARLVVNNQISPAVALIIKLLANTKP